MSSERTFIMIKPDGVARNLVAPIIKRFERRGYKLVAMKFMKADEELLNKHYEDLKEKKFFPSLIKHIGSGPVVPMVWEGKDAVKQGRVLLGETDPLKSKPGSIRGDYSIDMGRNIPAWQVFTHCVLGWPLYLLGLASTGRLANDGTFLAEGEIIDHFRPSSKMFPVKIRAKIIASTLTTIASVAFLFKLSFDYGFLAVFLWYTAPYMWTNFWLVTYTWLQHTDPSVPQYGADQWTWVKGALSTIDRPYGIFDYFHHKIGSTHVAHHLFHEMPFYRADEATAAIKAFLEPKGLYNYDPTPWYKAMWRIAKTCHYVEGTDGIQYYKSLEDIPLTKDLKKKAA